MATLYNIILVLHIAAAIVGLGGMIAHGALNARAFSSKASDARVLLSATQQLTNPAHYSVYGLFILGLILVSISSSALGDAAAISMGAPWVSASFVVVFAIVGVAHGLIKPAVRSLAESADELDDETVMSSDAGVISLAKKLAIGEGLTQLLVIVGLYLMIWKPGA